MSQLKSPIDGVRTCCITHQADDLSKQWGLTRFLRVMISCDECGSKRCAKAEDHRQPCSGR